MSETKMNPVERLRQSALAQVRVGDIEQALSLYDEALALAADDETRELITINKADAMIAVERSGPEVQALPKIVMRRRSLRHVYLASYALVFKYRKENELKRAAFYGELALEIAQEADELMWKIGALNELGAVYEFDSRFADAAQCFEQALSLVHGITDADQQAFSRIALVAELGYNRMLNGHAREGLDMLLSVIDRVPATAKAEALIDICYGYLEIDEYELARQHGEAALAMADEMRQIRNAHYLLGEAAYKSGDTDLANYHFDELAKFYPEFKNLKSVLYALDLRSMVNLKL